MKDNLEADNATQPVAPIGKVARLVSERQVLRYLLAGGWNSLFGYLCYAGFVALYSRVLGPRYLPLTVDIASVTATPFGVTMSFLTYKLFVFRTEGSYLREWLKCFIVYGSATIPQLFALPVVTRMLQAVPRLHGTAAYLAGAIVMGFTTIYTYLAHKNFSFSRRKAA